MPIGENAGGQLNVIVFEVGMKTTTEILGVEVVVVNTVSVHPLLVAPDSVRYSDASRSSIQQSGTSSQLTVGGRALREIVMGGTFGVDERGLLGYLGTGEMRFQRFYKEVVRMGEAMSAGDVDAAIDVINGTPGIRAFTLPYDENNSVFYINVYDFWKKQSFQVNIASFNDWITATKGGASGLRWYQMVLKEVGPIVTGGLGESIISALLQGLTTWASVNDALTSYTPTNLIDSFGAAVGIAAQQLSDTLAGVSTQIESVTQLMGGSYGSATAAATNDGAASLFVTMASVKAQAESLLDLLETLVSGGNVEETGAVDWTNDDGGWELGAFEQRRDLEDLVESASYQNIAGVLFGMDRDVYRDFVMSGGTHGQIAPDLLGSIYHSVRPTDSPESLESMFNVAWQRILEVNGLLPDEAMLEGTELQIPRVRPRGPTGISGLPTFGSHVGQEALGRDIAMEIKAGSNGDLELVEYEDCVEQGATFLVEWLGDDILRLLNTIPSVVRADFLGQQMEQLFRTDRRIRAITDISVEPDDTGTGYNTSMTLQTVNGGTLRLGGGA